MIPDQDKQKIGDYLQTKLSNFKCPACNAQSFTTEDTYYLDLEIDALDKISKGQQFGYLKKVAMSCDNCSHLSYFLASRMGI